MRGASNFAGYLKRPENYGVDAEGWFDTGDLARMDVEGYIRISGRSKDVIIRGGENIPVAEVENALYRHPSIAAVAIVAMPDDRLGERACAYVQLREGASPSMDELRQFLTAARMARQYFPERLEIVAELPRTPSRKIQKFKLREQARELSAARGSNLSEPHQRPL
jgi:cyclohexanecarboxylate-CoA ligase